MISEVNTVIRTNASKEYATAALKELTELCFVLGLLIQDEDSCDDSGDNTDIEAEINTLIDARAEAREVKDWARADEIRDRLHEMGIVIKDTPQGVQIIREKV